MMQDVPMKINLIGSPFGSSGYSNHVKGLANALHSLDHEVAIECELPKGWELQCNDAELEMIKNGHFDDGHTVFIGKPPYWELCRNDPCKSFSGFVVWEGDQLPKHWLSHLEKVDKIFVPSTHVVDAIVNSYKDNVSWLKGSVLPKTRIIPHGVDTDLFKPKKNKKKTFTFLCCKGWVKGMRDRGGLQYAVQAFTQEFKVSEDVELYLKINPAYGVQDVQGWIKEICDEPEILKKIFIDQRDLPQKDMPAVYQEAHVFLSPSMGEAFNLPVLEAMSCGLTCIVTQFGGHTDYANGLHIDYELIENTWEWEYEGVKWAKPDIKSLRKAMRKMFKDDGWLSKAVRESSRESAEKHTWKVSAEKLVEVLGK